MIKFNHKDWDTAFFKVKIGELVVGEVDFNPYIEKLKKQGYELIYVRTSAEFIPNNENTSIYRIGHIDNKLTFCSSIKNVNFKNPANVIQYTNGDDYYQLEQLGIESGVFSRFKLDANFGYLKFEQLYHKWMQNSLIDENRIVYVYRLDNIIVGFVTIDLNQEASIGLIAVDKHYRGKGIGGLLIDKAKFECSKRNYDTLFVATQGINKEACNLYQNNNFTLFKSEKIIHLWLT